MEESKDTNTRKRSGAPVTIIAAVVAFLVGIGLYALLSATVLKPTSNNNDSEKKDQPTSESSTISYEAYKDFVRRTNIIAFYQNTTDQIIVGGEPFYNLSEIANPKPELKTSFAFMYSNTEYPEQEKWSNATAEEAKTLHEAMGTPSGQETSLDMLFVYHNYDITDIQKAYKKLFGEEMDTSVKTITFSDSIVDCSVYLPSTKNLYRGLCGGGMGMNESYTYINNVVADGDKVYTYYNFLRSDYAFGDWLSMPNTSNLLCYDNYDKNRVSGCVYYFGNGITEYNYKKLQSYRLVFEKDADGNYAYKTAEKV